MTQRLTSGTEQKGPRMTTTTTVPGTPKLDVGSLENASALWLRQASFSTRSATTGHRRIELGPEHQTPGASCMGASTRAPSKAQPASGQVRQWLGVHSCVGFTNTTHFLRSVSSGKVLVEATTINQGRRNSCGVSTSTTAQESSSLT